MNHHSEKEQPRFAAYFRLSKPKLDDKGNVIEDPYGIVSQNKLINDFVASRNGILLKTFTEQISGNVKNRKKRIMIQQAISFTKRNRCTLLFAYVDRIARDVEFTAWLQNTGVTFQCVDVPDAGRLTINILATVAEEYSNALSVKIKRALAVRREKGLPMGMHAHKTPGPKITPQAREESIKTRKYNAKNNIINREGESVAYALYSEGNSVYQIHYIMKQRGYKSPTGKELSIVAVKRWLAKNTKSYNTNLPVEKSLDEFQKE